MTFTFNPALSSPLDRVRQTIGDTDSTSVELPDETINAYLTQMGNSVLQVAYQCANDLAAKWSRFVEITVDHQTSRGQQVADNYRKLAAALWTQIQQEGGGATEDTPGIWSTGAGDLTGPYDVWTLPQLCP